MRVLASNPQDDFRVKAYAGTNGVLLGIDLAEPRRRGLLGFAIEQKEGGRPWQWLLNSLTFPGQAHAIPRWNATPSNRAPIQKFRWADYSIKPNTTCQYRVHLAYGSPEAPALGESLALTVQTDDGLPVGHRVIFNRAVAASQAFGRKFPELDALLSANPEMPIEQWPAAPRNWLQHGLLDQVLAFLDRATGGQWALDIAIYEYELPAIIDAVNAAHRTPRAHGAARPARLRQRGRASVPETEAPNELNKRCSALELHIVPRQEDTLRISLGSHCERPQPHRMRLMRIRSNQVD